MPDREVLEPAALEAVCPSLYYDLADNLEITSDVELLEIIEEDCLCGECK